MGFGELDLGFGIGSPGIAAVFVQGDTSSAVMEGRIFLQEVHSEVLRHRGHGHSYLQMILRETKYVCVHEHGCAWVCARVCVCGAHGVCMCALCTCVLCATRCTVKPWAGRPALQPMTELSAQACGSSPTLPTLTLTHSRGETRQNVHLWEETPPSPLALWARAQCPGVGRRCVTKPRLSDYDQVTVS